MSYGLAYGLSAYGLSQQLKISTEEAREQMDAYFGRFGGVRDYLQAVVDQARKDGYTSTVLGRRRYLPELTSSTRQVREAAERAALNAPIQGSAADIIKVAMIEVDEALRAADLTSRMLLQVHDEQDRGRRRGTRPGRGAGAGEDGRRLSVGGAAGGVGRLRAHLGRCGALTSALAPVCPACNRSSNLVGHPCALVHGSRHKQSVILSLRFNLSGATHHMPSPSVTSPQVAVNDIGSAEDFLAAIDKTIKYFNDGDIVEGTIVKVDRDEVLLDIGYKTEGVIPSRELSIKHDVDPTRLSPSAMMSKPSSSPRRTKKAD